MSEDLSINKTYFKKYLCQERIGKGSFGVVYSGLNTSTKETIAIKMEKREENKGGTLELETYRLICLQGEGIPKVHCYGKTHTHYILIQELLGNNLEELFINCRRQFSLKTTCILGIEMIKRINFVHSRHHIHRDIKPENFMFGRNESEETLYLIDFGLSKKYYSTTRNEHIKFCNGKYLTGTARYCARNAHKGYEQSRRDDIESIGYVLMYFLLGSLPWQGLKLKPGEDQFEKIAEKKDNTSFSKLCQGQPIEFVQWFKYVDGLAFDETPNYEYLIGLFQEIINKHCLNCFYLFDWKKPLMQRVSVEKDNKSRNVSILVNNVNGHSTLNESHLLNEEMANNDEYKEGKFNKKFFAKDNDDNEGNEDNDNEDNDIYNDSPDFNEDLILGQGKQLKKQDDDQLDYLQHIIKKRNNSQKIVKNDQLKSKTQRKCSSPRVKQSSIRKTSQPLDTSKTTKNFGILVRELNAKRLSDELKVKEEMLKGLDPNTISDTLLGNNNNTTGIQRNSLIDLNKNDDKPIQSADIRDLNGKDLTKCVCCIF